MPDYGLSCPHLLRARTALEYCRFIYKIYAQTCPFPLDPFYEARGGYKKMGSEARDRLLSNRHRTLGTVNARLKKLDPLDYFLSTTPDPSKPSIYGDGDKASYALFETRPIDTSIQNARGFDLGGIALNQIQPVGPTGTARCGFFQGSTGQTAAHPAVGWPSYLGAVIREGTTCWITFRGSRSGQGARAAMRAQFSDVGNADWVTDMGFQVQLDVTRYGGNIKFCSGFHLAYLSCQASLLAAYNYANANAPTHLYITGHSLGGAFAQVAYLDLALENPNGLNPSLRDQLGARVNTAEIHCFPLSSPPVVIGLKAHHQLSRRCGGDHIHHYYAHKDAVHASPLVTPGMHTRVSSGLGGAHPMTHPHHLGTETALPDADDDFPTAHEVFTVYKGLWHGDLAYAAQFATFWPEIPAGPENGAVPGNFADGRPATLAQQQVWRDALEILAQPHPATGHDPFVTRAKLWAEVIKNEGKRNEAHKAVMEFEDLVFDMPTRGAPINIATTKMLWAASVGDKEHASSRVYLTLIMGCGVRQILQTAGQNVPAPTHRIYGATLTNLQAARRAVLTAWP